MIGWMFRTIGRAFRWLIWLTVICTALGFLMAFNCLTIPVFLVGWIGCKLLKQTPPHLVWYGMMAYPTWKHGYHPSFLRDMRRMIDTKPRKSGFVVVRPWEARFFD